MGAVSYIDMRKVAHRSKTLRELQRFYHRGYVDDNGSTYALIPVANGGIHLKLKVKGSYQDPIDPVVEEIEQGKYSGVISLWGGTPNFLFNAFDEDPWRYLCLDLCFVDNELVAAILDKDVVWSPYPIEQVRDKIKDFIYDLSSSSTDMNLFEKLVKQKNRNYRQPNTPSSNTDGPTVVITERYSDQLTNFFKQWMGHFYIGG